MIKKPHRDFSHFANGQNDKIGEVDDKTIKDCNDKVTEFKNDTSNRNGDFSLTLNMTKQTNHNMTTLTT